MENIAAAAHTRRELSTRLVADRKTASASASTSTSTASAPAPSYELAYLKQAHAPYALSPHSYLSIPVLVPAQRAISDYERVAGTKVGGPS